MPGNESTPSPSASEILTAQFYEWEHRGRGWLLWDHPVDIEPPFEPFRFHQLPFQGPIIDDARKATLLSWLADGLSALVSRRHGPGSDQANEEGDEESQPDPFDSESPIIEYRLSAPPELKVAKDAAEQFLLSVPRTAFPIAFEAIGTAQTLALQMACRDEDRAQVRGQLQAHFPDITLTAQDRSLIHRWEAVQEGHLVIVDLGLSQEFMLPLRGFRNFQTDPLTGVLGALSDLEEREIAVLQVLFQHARHPWAESMIRSVMDDEGKSFFIDAPMMPKIAREKASRPLFATVIRLAATSPRLDRAWGIVRAVSGALHAYSEPTSNEFIPLSNDGYDSVDHLEDLLLRRSRRSGMLLNSEELVSLVHPPSETVRIPKLLREERKTKRAPAIATGNTLQLGKNAHSGQTVEVSLNPEQRSRHMYVVGASGTGKSTLLLHLINQDLESGQGLGILDPHGDLIDEVLGRIPENRVKDVVILDPADENFPVGFNILSAHSELEKTLLSSDLVAIFRSLSESWGDQMNSVFANAIVAFLESSRGGTLVDLRKFLLDVKFRNDFLETVDDPEVVYFWKKQFPMLSGRPQTPILTRLDTFLRPKLIRNMVAQKDDRIDLGEIMNSGKIFLARLSQGAIGEENARLLGNLVVAKLQQIAMSRQEVAQEKRRPFYFYIDEFHNFITPTMAQILSGARKYRLALILAHQDLQQLASRDKDVLNSVISNPYTRVCFRVGDQDAQTLEKGFSSFDRKDLQNLGIGQAVVRMERAEYDFNVDTPLPPRVDPDEAETRRGAAVEHSRKVYARSREEIETLIRDSAESLLGIDLTRKREVEKAPPVPTPARTAPPDVPPPAAPKPRKRAKMPEAPVLPGRGGQQHRYLQELIRRWAESKDWQASVEEPILDGLGNVDVALRRGEHTVACEIGVSSPPERELENIQKCLAGGFDQVVWISTEKKTLTKVRALVSSAISKEDRDRVVVATPDEVFSVLEAIDAEEAGSEQTFRGYRVKVRYKAVAEGEKAEKRKAVSSVIARALRRLAD
ncbi:MAG: ATP-binding protein [Candidatus Eisenbacteria bacterium]|nr:ATP-binding protein [Candidatus Eisenbacteria bacterium]